MQVTCKGRLNPTENFIADSFICGVCAGDIFLLDERDIIHTNLSVREGLGEEGGGWGGGVLTDGLTWEGA